MYIRYQTRNAFCGIILLLFAIALASCENRTYSGTLAMRGNAPFSKLVLAADDGRLFELVGDTSKTLMSHQYQRVVIAGKEIEPAKGPGFPAKLEVVKIISIGTK